MKSRSHNFAFVKQISKMWLRWSDHPQSGCLGGSEGRYAIAAQLLSARCSLESADRQCRSRNHPHGSPTPEAMNQQSEPVLLFARRHHTQLLNARRNAAGRYRLIAISRHLSSSMRCLPIAVVVAVQARGKSCLIDTSMQSRELLNRRSGPPFLLTYCHV